MKDKPISDELREILWRRQPSDAERARAAGQPEFRAELELETRLNDALAQLPAARVSSNFTARVMQAIDLEEARAQRPGWRSSWHLSWPRLLPRLAATLAVVAFAALSWQHHEISQHRLAMAQSLALVAGSPASPGVDALDNYEAIQRMGQSQPADDKLLALMQ